MFQNSFGNARRRSDVDARLDGEHHARFQHAPFAADLVVADIMHVEAEPVPGAMAEKLQVRFGP